MIDSLVRSLLLAIKNSDDYNSLTTKEQQRLKEILAFVSDRQKQEEFYASKNTSMSLCQIKVSLKGIKPSVWRRVVLPYNYTFRDLHRVIQITMGWTGMHLYNFDVNGIIIDGDMEDIDYDPDDLLDLEEKMDASAVLIGDFLLQKGAKCNYTYDLSSCWEHTILLEKILPLEDSFLGPVCLTGRRAGPLENSGGVDGYENLLWILSGLELSEDASLRDWIPIGFDSELFDVDLVNELLTKEFNEELV